MSSSLYTLEPVFIMFHFWETVLKVESLFISLSGIFVFPQRAGEEDLPD